MTSLSLMQRIKERLKDHTYRRISDAGYRLTPRMYVDSIEMWYHLRELFSRQAINTVLDVGANEGQYRNFLRRRCGFDGWVVSFEPVRAVYDILQAQAKDDPRWLVFNYALGSKNEFREFNVMRDTRFSSFLEPNNSSMEGLDVVEKNVVVRREKVEVQCLSDVIQRLRRTYSLGRIYLKMDTQGYDFEVLRGGGMELGKIVALQTEVPIKSLYEGMISFSQAVEMLKAYGFDVTGVFTVSKDLLMRVLELDCVAINPRMSL
jgi:FkbM family methyltransferase